ncbi:uncharacterized protein LOC142348834 isoform X2 [Convolutriloba macropyga]|uniref:uncharacterized protein LOC142348834 isoform X2 n=1 Tax=Convolutriloba macropyga TaxID=536237 RepID=UPI003F51CF9E
MRFDWFNRAFKAPEKFLRFLFTQIAVVISRFPLTALSLNLSLSFALIFFSFLKFDIIWADTYTCYQPEQFQKIKKLSGQISNEWSIYKNNSTGYKKSDTIQIFFYDTYLNSDNEKVNLIHAVYDVCGFISNYSLFVLPLNRDIKYRNLTDDGSDVYDESTCEAAKEILPLLDTVEEQTVMEYMVPMLAQEVKDRTGMEIKDNYFPLLPITFTVMRNDISAQWQISLFKALVRQREIVESTYDVKFVYTDSAYNRGEETRVIKAEMPKLVLSIGLLIASTIIVCINMRVWTYSRGLLACAAVFMSILAVVLGLAIGNILRYSFISLLAFVPFLIIGIGIDSAFLLMHQWLINLQSNKCLSHTQLMVATVQGCFLSVTLSDFTAITAFVVGCSTAFPAVKICCVYLALCVLSLWVTELLFFLPCLAIRSRSLCNQLLIPEDVLPIRADLDDSIASEDSEICQGYEVFNWYEKMLMKLAIFVTSKELFRIVWIFSFICITCAATYYMSIMKSYENNVKYYQDSSIVREYYVTLQKYATTQQIINDVIIKIPENSENDKWQNLTANDAFLSSLKNLQKEMNKTGIYRNPVWIDCILQISEKNDITKAVDENLDELHLAKMYSADIEELVDKCREGVEYSVKTDQVSVNHQLNSVSLSDRSKTTEDVQDNMSSIGNESQNSSSVHNGSKNFEKSSEGKNLVQEDKTGPRSSEDNKAMEKEVGGGSDRTSVNVLQLHYVKIKVLRVRAQMFETKKRNELMRQMTSLENEFSEDLGLELYDWEMVLMWRDWMMESSLWKSVAMAGGCCLVMVTLFIPHLLLIVTTLLMTAVTFINITGTMSLMGMTYCPQTYVVSLIAMGMSIDYIAHSARCFFTTHRHHHTHHTRASNGARVGSNDANITTYRQKRKDGKGHENDDGLEVLKQTMAEISVPLTNSAFTTILGISLLVFAESLTFRDIGYSVIAIFLHSYVNGCYVLPVLLHYISKIGSGIFDEKEMSRRHRGNTTEIVINSGGGGGGRLAVSEEAFLEIHGDSHNMVAEF